MSQTFQETIGEETALKKQIHHPSIILVFLRGLNLLVSWSPEGFLIFSGALVHTVIGVFMAAKTRKDP